MVTWDKPAIERLIAALLASHPELKVNYRSMAVYFGQGATYDSIQSRFREYHKVAQEMASGTGRPPQTPRSRGNNNTPRTNSRGGISKPSAKGKPESYVTPTKKGSLPERTANQDVIVLDSDSEEIKKPFAVKEEPKVLDLAFKREASSSSTLVANGIKAEDVFTTPIVNSTCQPVNRPKHQDGSDSDSSETLDEYV